MYEKFKYERIALFTIKLDDRNPRIVTQEKLPSEEAIIEYLFEYEDLGAFVKMMASEGRNPGAERPYVVKDGKGYVVIEGNTRIATYKLLTGQLASPAPHLGDVPLIDQATRDELVSVDVAIAPSRDSLMAVMARAHFGRGDKSKWGYLGSRKALYDDWQAGKSVAQLANVFARPAGQIRDYLVEYLLYLEALNLAWTPAEKEILLRPSLEFNPPVRFLQSTGHKQLVGIELDKVNLQINFTAPEAKAKFQHLVKRTVIDEKGPSATASYSDVFFDFVSPSQPTHAAALPGAGAGGSSGVGGAGASLGAGAQPGGQGADPGAGGAGPAPELLKPNTLFNYPLTRNDLTLQQLMKEAKTLNAKTYPAAGSALLRSIVEVILKIMIEEKKLNPQNKRHDLESALNVMVGANLNADDKAILKEFKTHVSYLNLTSHATVVPNPSRLFMARDCVDAFVKRNV